MAFEDTVAEYQRRRAEALGMGGSERLARRKAQGVLNARERLDLLLDPGSFSESGLHARSIRPEMRDRTPADGKIAGFGRIDGRGVAVVANDFTVLGASSSVVNMKKIRHVKEIANARGLPLILLGESSGARMPDRMGAAGRASFGQDPFEYQRLRQTPWVSAMLGPCYGSSTWYACMSDYVVMRKGATMAVASERVTSMAINQPIDAQELGGWKLQTEVTGAVDLAVDTDEEAIAAVRRFLSYLPSHQNEPPPVADVPPGSDDQCSTILELLPEARNRVYDMRKIIAAVVDRGSLFELKARFGRSVVTGFARLDGQPIGIIANNGRRNRCRCLPEGNERPRHVGFLQPPDRDPRGSAGLPDRRRRRDARRAGEDHQLDERPRIGDDAEDLDRAAQELWAGLSEHGRRTQFERGRLLADGRFRLYGPGRRDECPLQFARRGRPRTLPHALCRADPRYFGLGPGRTVRGASRHRPARYPRVPQGDARGASAAADRGVGRHLLANWPTSY